jgi:hypothetical protein
MKISKVLYVILLFASVQTINAQNLLNTNAWTVGSGSVSGFSQYGTTSENSRILETNHLGNSVIIWQATPDSAGGRSGGFSSPVVNIDHTKTYRLSVWIKKSNANSGTTQLKPETYSGGSYHATYLNGTPLTWQPFWYGSLPKFDRWYLLVGFIHRSSYNSTVSLGKIYDGVTGESVISMKDQKFKTSATVLKHKTILYGATNTTEKQFMYSPYIEEVNGNEFSVNQLLGVNPDSQLTFTYDTAGNQTERFYCPDNCASTSKTANEKEKKDIVESATETLKNLLTLYPNPTEGLITVKLESELLEQIESLNVYSTNGVLIKTIKAKSQNLKIDLTDMPSGVYFLHIHSNNGNDSITKKIIKN